MVINCLSDSVQQEEGVFGILLQKKRSICAIYCNISVISFNKRNVIFFARNANYTMGSMRIQCWN